MKAITTSDELNEAIQRMESLQALERNLLKEYAVQRYLEFKPENLIRTALMELTKPSAKESILITSMGLVLGYLTKKVAFGNTNNPIKQLMGTILQIGITSVIAKNSENIKTAAVQALTVMHHIKQKVEAVQSAKAVQNGYFPE